MLAPRIGLEPIPHAFVGRHTIHYANGAFGATKENRTPNLFLTMEAFYRLNYGSMVAGYASDSDAIVWIVHHIQTRVMSPLFGGDGQIRTDGKGLPVRWVAASRLTTWLRHH